MYTDDPVHDFERYDFERERRAQTRPVCSVCGERIMDDTAVYIDGWICNDCIERNKRYLED